MIVEGPPRQAYERLGQEFGPGDGFPGNLAAAQLVHALPSFPRIARPVCLVPLAAAAESFYPLSLPRPAGQGWRGRQTESQTRNAKLALARLPAAGVETGMSLIVPMPRRRAQMAQALGLLWAAQAPPVRGGGSPKGKRDWRLEAQLGATVGAALG